MPKLLLTIIIFTLVYSGCAIPKYTEKSTLNEMAVNKSDSKITTVLVIGVGSTVSRVFLDNLSPEIIKLFAGAKIQCDYNYAGRIPRHTHVNLQKIISSKYDAYLVLNPIDTSYFDPYKDKAFLVAPLPGGDFVTGAMVGNQYKEDYYVELYTNGGSLNKVWQAELKVDFDMTKPARYTMIARKIFESLMKNGFIRKP